VRRVVLALAALIVLGTGAVGGWYYHDQTRTREKRGSSTVEFVATAPVVKKRPARSLATRPWPIYGYDPARTRNAPFRLRPPYRKVWTLRTGNTIEFPPVVGYGLLFVEQIRGRFFAVNAATGKRQWRRHFRHCAAASPALGAGVVYQAYMQPYPCKRYPRSQPGFIVALSVRGRHGRLVPYARVLWKFAAGAIESSPLLVDGTLYFGSWNHAVYALDVHRDRVAVLSRSRFRKRFLPRLRWKFHADGEINSSPAYGSGMIYFGTNAGSIYAVDARTGRERWHSHSYSRFGRREYFYATPTVAYGRVYIGNTDGTLYAYGARTGHLLWARHAGSYIYTGAAIWRHRVIVGTYSGEVIAYDAATGDVRWKHEAPSAIHGAPSVVNGLVYFSTCPVCGSHGSRSTKQGRAGTFAVDARTGRLVWKFTDGRYSPVVADQHRLYVTGRTRVYAFEPVHKQKAKKHEPKRHERR
jgi:outer membrane protein assembly factor BamB